MNLSLADKMRATHIDRFQLVRTARKQTIAEHMWCVTMLVKEVSSVLGADPTMLIKAALEHDIDEVIMGDIPTPTKQRALERGWDLNTLSGMISSERMLTDQQKSILKVCDKLDGIRFLQMEGMGSHAKAVKERLYGEMNTITRSCDDDTRQAMRVVIDAVLREGCTI